MPDLSKNYLIFQDHAHEMDQFSIAMESDIGTFAPRGLTFNGKNKTSQCILHEILSLMKPINATKLVIDEEGSDTEMFIPYNVPITSLENASEDYFFFHHSQGDTMTVESRVELDKCQALWTSVAYALAALDQPLPR